MSWCCGPFLEFLYATSPPFRLRTRDEAAGACGAGAAPAELRAALDLTCGLVGEADETDHLFRLIGKPKRNDWLDIRTEFGETFEEYRNWQTRPAPVTRRLIVIVPVANLTQPHWRLFFEHLVAYCGAFFPGMTVSLAEQPLPCEGVRKRKNEYGHVQYHVDDVMERLRETSDKGVHCRLAITVYDLFDTTGRCTDEGGNVGGAALMDEGLGVMTLARAFPHFYDGLAAADASFDLGQRQISAWLRRARHMMCHELVHMFGFPHCVFMHCLMNGGNGPNDSCAGMLFLCPVCLHKVLHSLRNVTGEPTLEGLISRYEALRASLQDLTERFEMASFDGSALQYDIAWLDGRLSHLRGIQVAAEAEPGGVLNSAPQAPRAPSERPWTQRFDDMDLNMIRRAERDAAREAAKEAAANEAAQCKSNQRQAAWRQKILMAVHNVLPHSHSKPP